MGSHDVVMPLEESSQGHDHVNHSRDGSSSNTRVRSVILSRVLVAVSTALSSFSSLGVSPKDDSDIDYLAKAREQ